MLGTCKNLGISPNEVLDMTYESVLMYSLATPTYNNEKGKAKKSLDTRLDASNPSNFNHLNIDEE